MLTSATNQRIDTANNLNIETTLNNATRLNAIESSNDGDRRNDEIYINEMNYDAWLEHR
jgi:hypothetical protein